MQIGIIGGGAIATFLLKVLQEEQVTDIEVTSILVRDKQRYAYLESYGVTLYTDRSEFLDAPIDVVVEAATVEAVKEEAPHILKRKDLVLISIGALVDDVFLHELKMIAKTYDTSLYLPSGAIGGLDLLKNANALDGVTEVTLTTRKPAHTLTSDSLTEEKLIFSGTAREAIAKYPKNINVAIVLSLAGIGMDDTKVRVIADPYTTKNSHSIKISGAFGTSEMTITNEPLEENPSTSYLAAMSILQACIQKSSRIQIA